jgi:hypothetical protein
MFMQTLVIMVVLMDQHEWSLLVVAFILLIQVFFDVSIESKLLFSKFKVLDTNPRLNFQLLLMFIALYDYKISFNLLGLGEELERSVKP